LRTLLKILRCKELSNEHVQKQQLRLFCQSSVGVGESVFKKTFSFGCQSPGSQERAHNTDMSGDRSDPNLPGEPLGNMSQGDSSYTHVQPMETPRKLPAQGGMGESQFPKDGQAKYDTMFDKFPLQVSTMLVGTSPNDRRRRPTSTCQCCHQFS